MHMLMKTPMQHTSFQTDYNQILMLEGSYQMEMNLMKGMEDLVQEGGMLIIYNLQLKMGMMEMILKEMTIDIEWCQEVRL